MLILDMRKKWFTIAAGVLVLFWLSSKGYVIHSDSYEYINHYIYRPPFYPLFLDLWRAVFGANYLFFVQLFQIAAVQCCAILPAVAFKRRFSLSDTQTLAMYIIFILPLFDTKIVFGGIGNLIIPEAFSYCCLLGVLYLLTETDTSNKNLFRLAVLAAVSTLVRPQLAFFYPAAIAAALSRKTKPGTLAALAAALVLLFGGVSITERLYHKLENGVFAKVSVAPHHLAGKAMYFADKHLLKNLPEQDRQTAILIHQKLDEKKLTSRHSTGISAIASPIPFNDICWGTFERFYRKSECADSDSHTQCYLKLHAFSGRIDAAILPQYGAAIGIETVKAMLGRLNLLTFFFIIGFTTAVLRIKDRELVRLYIIAAVMLATNWVSVELFSDGSKRLYLYSAALELTMATLTICMVMNRKRPIRRASPY